MATMDVDACVVDTNVLIYSTVSGKSLASTGTPVAGSAAK